MKMVCPACDGALFGTENRLGLLVLICARDACAREYEVPWGTVRPHLKYAEATP